MPLNNKHKGRAVKWRRRKENGELEHEHSYNTGWVFLDPNKKSIVVQKQRAALDEILVYSSPPDELVYVPNAELEDWETRDRYEPTPPPSCRPPIDSGVTFRGSVIWIGSGGSYYYAYCALDSGETVYININGDRVTAHKSKERATRYLTHLDVIEKLKEAIEKPAMPIPIPSVQDIYEKLFGGKSSA